MLYFAYGSNMDWGQMRERCRSARFVGIAVFPDHELTFPRKSLRLGCGVAGVVADVGSKVWGVVYEIDELDVGPLDASEGYAPGRPKDRNSYTREERRVLLDGNDDRPLAVSIYVAEPQDNPPLPSEEYKNLIVSGARFWHLPEDYIRELEQIEVSV